MTLYRRRFLTLLTALAAGVSANTAQAAEELPVVWIIGDSTVHNTVKSQRGWGDVIGKYFDAAKVRVENRAIGGRSSRSFLTEGSWRKVLEGMKPGDFLIVQFGHNDGGGLRKSPQRASLKGNSEAAEETVDAKTGSSETVHTFGWYLRKYAEEAKTKGVTPVLCSLVPRNIWKDGKVGRGGGDYGLWTSEAATQAGVKFIDLNRAIADKYDALGEEQVKAFFPDDHTHTNADGAELNAQCLVAEIRKEKDSPLAGFLRPAEPQ